MGCLCPLRRTDNVLVHSEASYMSIESVLMHKIIPCSRYNPVVIDPQGLIDIYAVLKQKNYINLNDSVRLRICT